MKITRRQLLKTGLFATAATLLPVNLFGRSTPPPNFKFSNTTGLARKCLHVETLKPGDLPRYERGIFTNPLISNPNQIINSSNPHYIKSDEVWVNPDFEKLPMEQEDQLFMDLLKALRKESKNIHLLPENDLTIKDCNTAFSLIEQHDLIAEHVIVNSNTLEKFENFGDMFYSTSGNREWALKEENRFLWTSNVFVHNDLKDNEMIILARPEYVGVITQRNNKMGMAIINDYAVSFTKLPNLMSRRDIFTIFRKG